MSAPTPGPWSVAGKGTIRGPGQSVWVAHVHWQNRDANARLISAAPDLLAALIGLGEAMRNFDGADARLMQPAALAARAAIAKAQGRP